jgi:hypothetical protein
MLILAHIDHGKKIKTMKTMKTILSILIASFFIISCSTNYDNRINESANLRISLLELISQNKLEQIVLSDFSEEERNQIIADFSNPNKAINLIDEALNNGYLLLLEDVENGMYPCLNINDLKEKYKRTQWESRNIGFPNSITRIEGAMLLKEIQILVYEIFIMKLLDDEKLKPMIAQKEALLKKEAEELLEYTKEGTWTD